MHHKSWLISSVALSALLVGCVGTGPNTQQGAVNGAALGAIAGAIIGNNSGGHNGAAGALIGAVAGTIAGGTMGNSIDQQNGTVYGYGYPAARPAYYRNTVQPQPPAPPPPPAVSEVVTPAPAANALWVPGYWDYNGTGYNWSSGHWEIPPPESSTYIAAHWETRGGAYVFVRGYWR